jgi:TRAP-type C4-dicarboxylate transport system permease small subunit
MFFVKATKFINKITSEIASWIVFMMMLLAVADVAGRYIFGASIFGAQDITQLMMVIVVFLGFGVQAEEDGNVRIEILYQHFGPKLKAVMNIFAWLIGIAGYSLITYRLYLRAMSIFVKHNASTITLGISLAPFLLIAAIGCGLMVLQLVSNIILNVMELCGKNSDTDALKDGGNT